jgi:hypothetical protein
MSRDLWELVPVEKRDFVLEAAKGSSYGGVYFSGEGPLLITKEGVIGWYGRELP